MKKREISSRAVAVLASLWFTVVLNLGLWRFAWQTVAVTGLPSALFAASLPVFVFVGLYLIFSLAVMWPYVWRPLLVVLLALSAAANYAMTQYGIFMDVDMIRNVFETNRREALDYVNLGFLLWFGLTAALPALWLGRLRIKWRSPGGELKWRGLVLALSLVALGAIGATLYKPYVFFGRNHREARRLINPTAYIYATAKYFRQSALSRRRFEVLDDGVSLAGHRGDKPRVLVLVVGEAARAANFSLGGYDRDTNPELAKEDIVYYPDATSSGTATAISVPAMFSDLGRGDFDVGEAPYRENLVDLLSKAGLKTVWLENDDGCKRVCDRIGAVDVTRLGLAEAKAGPGGELGRYCDPEEGHCYDEVLLPPLAAALDQVNGDTLIVLHTIGSHGPAYYKRYPPKFRVFRPTCDTSEVQGCPQEAIRDTYDNTILYTDHVLGRIIALLAARPRLAGGLLYVSDHGQSLGEGGIYLHGLPYALAPEEQKRIPMLLWLPPATAKGNRLDYGCLKSHAGEPVSHDHVFHSVAGFWGLRTKLYRPELDLFAPCRF